MLLLIVACNFFNISIILINYYPIDIFFFKFYPIFLIFLEISVKSNHRYFDNFHYFNPCIKIRKVTVTINLNNCNVALSTYQKKKKNCNRTFNF